MTTPASIRAEPGPHFDAQVPHADRRTTLIDSIRRRETRPEGSHGGPITLAHSLLKLLYDGSKTEERRRRARRMLIDGSDVRSLLRLRLRFRTARAYRQKILPQGRDVAPVACARRWAAARAIGLGVPFEKVLEVGSRLACSPSPEFRTRSRDPPTHDRRSDLPGHQHAHQPHLRALCVEPDKAERGSIWSAASRKSSRSCRRTCSSRCRTWLSFLQQAPTA